MKFGEPIRVNTITSFKFEVGTSIAVCGQVAMAAAAPYPFIAVDDSGRHPAKGDSMEEAVFNHLRLRFPQS